MNKEDLQYFKKLLLEKRAELLEELGHLKENALDADSEEASGENAGYSYHMADLGTDAMEREKAFLFAHREGRLLYHLERALERIEAGTYGYCEICKEPIGRERLEAVPHARLCIKCKAKEETA